MIGFWRVFHATRSVGGAEHLPFRKGDQRLVGVKGMSSRHFNNMFLISFAANSLYIDVQKDGEKRRCVVKSRGGGRVPQGAVNMEDAACGWAQWCGKTSVLFDPSLRPDGSSMEQFRVQRSVAGRCMGQDGCTGGAVMSPHPRCAARCVWL